MTLDEYLTVKDAAERLNMKENTVRHWICDDKIKHTKLMDHKNSRVMIPKSEIIRIEQERQKVGKWLTVESIMKLTGMCRPTIYKFIHRDLVPYIMSGNQIRVDPVGLEKYLNRKTK